MRSADVHIVVADDVDVSNTLSLSLSSSSWWLVHVVLIDVVDVVCSTGMVVAVRIAVHID